MLTYSILASEQLNCDTRDISRVKSDDLFVQQYLVGQDGDVDKAFKLMVNIFQLPKFVMSIN